MGLLDDIVNDGFVASPSNKNAGYTTLASMSLDIALKAFFSTYREMKYRLHLFQQEQTDQETVDINHSYSYRQACAESIVHFQHFAELVCKDILRDKHRLLTTDVSNQPLIYYKLLCGESLTDDEENNLKTVEFSAALCRLRMLVGESEISPDGCQFTKQDYTCLERLNYLRNRLWHRGVYFLRYPALDKFIGRYVLPFILKTLALGRYKWPSYVPIDCGIDPLRMIATELEGDSYDLGKVAFLKELGRAAYANPLGPDNSPWFDLDNANHIHRAERTAGDEIGQPNVNRVTRCPVCGVRSLVIYYDIDEEGFDPETNTAEAVWKYTYEVKCMCCDFEVNHFLENPRCYDLPIEDYWTSEQC